MNPPPLTWTKATFHVPIHPPGESKIVPFPVDGIVARLLCRPIGAILSYDEAADHLLQP
jgi:hypothetical protein